MMKGFFLHSLQGLRLSSDPPSQFSVEKHFSDDTRTWKPLTPTYPWACLYFYFHLFIPILHLRNRDWRKLFKCRFLRMEAAGFTPRFLSLVSLWLIWICVRPLSVSFFWSNLHLGTGQASLCVIWMNDSWETLLQLTTQRGGLLK